MKSNRQNEQMKKGGEIARSMYYAFMSRPEWQTELSEEHRRRLVEFLEESFWQEKQAAALFTQEWYKQKTKTGDLLNTHVQAASDEAFKRTQRMFSIMKLQQLLRREEGKLYDVSVYCRNN